MKNLCVLFVVIIAALCSVSGYAADANKTQDPEDVEEAAESVPSPSDEELFEKNDPSTLVNSEYPCMFFAAGGGGGTVYPSGKLSGVNATREYQPVYGGGFSLGILAYSFLGVSFECEYLKEKLLIHRTYAGTPLRDLVNLDFMNFMFGYYGSWKILYAEIGYYRGIGVFPWEKKTECNGARTTETISTKEKRSINGLYYGAGFTFTLSGDFHLKLGVRAEQPVTPAIVNSDRIRPDTVLFRGELEYHLPL